MYFYYGITHSTLENPEEEIELKVDQNTYNSPPEQTEHTAVWDRHGYENRMAEDGSSWNGGGGCWNAGNTINSGLGDQPPSISVTKSQSQTTNGVTSNKKPASHSSSSKLKQSKQPPPPPANKATNSKSTAAKSTQPPATAAAASKPQTSSAPIKDGFGMFVEETQFPQWDD